MTAKPVTPWRWAPPRVVFAIHDMQLAQHGGRQGIGDLGMIESALSRPENLSANSHPDACDLAAAYAFGLAKNHGFVDGNKRTAWVVARLFLADNGFNLVFDKLEAISTVENLAAGCVSEAELSEWFKVRMTPQRP